MNAQEPWRPIVAGPAARDIQRRPEKYATAIVEALAHIAENPRRLGKPLRLELDGHWSARRGPYRIITRSLTTSAPSRSSQSRIEPTCTALGEHVPRGPEK